MGWAARSYSLARGLPFTTSFHTRFPEYVHARCRLPVARSCAVIRRFHRPAVRMMVATGTLAADLFARGFGETAIWSRGVDLELFRPRPRNGTADARPIQLYVGRVAVEKNIEDFLALDSPGTKRVVGEGPQLASLRRQYPQTRFLGVKTGEALAAAYPVPGPRDVIAGHAVGCLDDDLGRAVAAALTVSLDVCRAYAERFSWRASAEQFLAALAPFAD